MAKDTGDTQSRAGVSVLEDGRIEIHVARPCPGERSTVVLAEWQARAVRDLLSAALAAAVKASP